MLISYSAVTQTVIVRAHRQFRISQQVKYGPL